MSYRGRGRSGFHNNNNNNNNRNNFNQQNVDQFVSANSIPVEILGWNGATPDECVKFISRKCRIVVSNYNVEPTTGILKGYVKNQKEADELCTWSGVKFAGQSLKITKATAANSMSSQMGVPNASSGNSTIETITQFLKSRYQPEIKMLNLSSVQQDANLASKGFFASISTTSKFFPALMKVAKELKLDVSSIDLSGNNLTDLSTISTLAQTFPLLQNLSLLNNNFNRLKLFETWRHKLNFLRELIIIGNPLFNNQSNPNEILNIKIELMKSFPRLIVLNGEIIRNEQALLNNLTFPFDPSQSMFFQDEEVQNMSTNFITNFYKLWDSNRQELLVLYQENSQFSMQVDSSHPYILEANATGAYGGSTDFGYYLPQSRNLTRVSSVKSRSSRVAQGQEQIFKLFSQLPKTRHDLMTQPQIFSMESHRFPQLNGIIITLHGSFEETGVPDNNEAVQGNVPHGSSRNRYNSQKSKKIALSTKSFDRTFVVIPGPNGSFIVASDLLLIRSFGGSQAWNDTTRSAEAPAQPQAAATPVGGSSVVPPSQVPTPTAADLPPEVKANLNPIQQDILVKILLETKLNLQYGIMLCEQSNWDYQQCTVNFKNSVASLPRDAYIV